MEAATATHSGKVPSRAVPSSHAVPKSHQSSAGRPLPLHAAPRNRAEHFAVNAAMSDSNTGDLLRRWDKGSRNQRIAILSRFVLKHKNSTAAEIEKDLGHSALLLFTHITAWLRLTYPLGYELSVQLSAIALFLQGQKFLSNFLEVGGIQTLTDILMLPVTDDATRSDKNNCLLLLLHISNSGRVYREMICDGAGTDCVVKATVGETDEKTLELTAALLLSLGQGNPRKASLVHGGLIYLMLHGCDEAALSAATTLRSLQISAEQHLRKAGGAESTIGVVGAEGGSKESSDALLDAFFHLLAKDNVKLRFEGTELLSMAAKNSALTLPILGRCLDVLDDSRPEVHESEDEDLASVVRWQRKQTACGRAALTILLRPHADDSLHRMLAYLDRRGAHHSLFRYLKLAETKDVGALLDVVRSLQLICRAGQGAVYIPGRFPNKCAKYCCELLGENNYETFLCEPITDEHCQKLVASSKGSAPQETLALTDKP